MRPFAALITLALSSIAITVPVHADTQSPREVTVAFLESNNCRADKRELENAFSEAGLDTELAFPEVMSMLSDKLLLIDPKTDEIILPTGDVCEGEQIAITSADPKARRAFMKLFEQNDCTIDGREGQIRALYKDYSKEQLDIVLAEALNEGRFKIDMPNNLVTLTAGPVCGEDKK